MIYRSVQLPNKTVKYLYRTDGEYVLLTPEGYTDLSEITAIIAQAHGLSELVIRALIKALPVIPAFNIWTLDLTPLLAPPVSAEISEELTEQKEEVTV